MPARSVTSDSSTVKTRTSYECGQAEGRIGIDNAASFLLRLSLDWWRFMPCYLGVLSWKRAIKPSRLGICTFGSVRASMAWVASINLFCARM
jgi:hypothetical protein